MFLFKTRSKVTLEDKAIKTKTTNEILRTSVVGVKGTVCGGDCRNENSQKDQSLDSVQRRVTTLRKDAPKMKVIIKHTQRSE